MHGNVGLNTIKQITSTMSQSVTSQAFGFIYHNITYIWRNKSLWRQKFNRANRYYEERKLKYRKVGNSYGYVIDGDFKSMRTLKEITCLLSK